MLLVNIPDFVTCAQLDFIEYMSNFDCSVNVSLICGEDQMPVFEDSYIFFSHRIQIFGLGQIIKNFMADKVAINCSLVIRFPELSSDPVEVKSFIAINSAMRVTPDFDSSFLCHGRAALCPPGSSFFLTAVGHDIVPKEATLLLKGKGLRVINQVCEDPAVIFEIRMPDSKGCYHVELGKRKFTFFVADMYSVHSIGFRNHFNAREIIHLPAAVSVSPTMAAQLAKSAGETVSYDVTRTVKIDLHAKCLPEIIFSRIKFLGFGSSFYIDNIPVVISNIEPKFSPESDEMYELKLSAQVTFDSPDWIYDHSFRIFKNQYNISFN